MSKIVTAVNSMISHSELITHVLPGTYEGEIFFKYSKKHNWSILKTTNGGYALNFYPGNPSLDNLASLPDEAWQEHAPRYVSYNTKDLATQEALDSFRDLYSIVSEKAYGMDDVLNEIIGKEML